jgi:hypothetical protein
MSRTPIDPLLWCKGRRVTIEFPSARTGRLPAKEFIEGLDASDQRKLALLFQVLAAKGAISNRQTSGRSREQSGSSSAFRFALAASRPSTLDLDSWFRQEGRSVEAGRAGASESDQNEHLEREQKERMKWPKR